jgi:hypothetical protein
MASVIGIKCGDALIRQHTAEKGGAPDARQSEGYRKVGDQFGRFYLQYRSVKDMNRCRQILYANIPKICEEHGLDAFEVHTSLEALCMGDPGDLWAFYQSVGLFHSQSETPVQPSMGGCLIPLALVATVPAALFVLRTLA